MALAALVNVTIDDTSSLIAYSPPDSWRSSSEACKTCLEPDKRLAYAWTWHDGTHIIPTVDGDDLPNNAVSPSPTPSATAGGDADKGKKGDDDDKKDGDDDDDEEEDGSSDDEESDESSSNEVEDALRDFQGTDEAELCREGGARLIQHLLSRAIPPEDEGEKVSPPNVHEWTFRDIVLLPKNEQKEWFNACREELEALRQRNVYDLVDRPKGRKVIKNRWVFDEKPDGRKKARLVAKGFSQVEGEDFDKDILPSSAV